MLRYRYAKESPKHGYIDRHYAGIAGVFHGSQHGVPHTFPAHLITARARYERPGIALEVRGFKTDQGNDVMGPVGCTEKGVRMWKTGILEMKAADKVYKLLAAKIRKIVMSRKSESVKAAMIESLMNEAQSRGLDNNSDSVN